MKKKKDGFVKKVTSLRGGMGQKPGQSEKKKKRTHHDRGKKRFLTLLKNQASLEGHTGR